MRFIDVIKICLIKYFDISGRAKRREYWCFQIFLFLIVLVCIGLEVVIYYATDLYIFDIIRLYLIFNSCLLFLLLMLNTSVTVRRFHDTDRNITYLLLYLIPVWGLIINTIFLAQAGDEHSNHYGEPPVWYGDVIDTDSVVVDTEPLQEEIVSEPESEYTNENKSAISDDNMVITSSEGSSYRPPWKD